MHVLGHIYVLDFPWLCMYELFNFLIQGQRTSFETPIELTSIHKIMHKSIIL